MYATIFRPPPHNFSTIPTHLSLFFLVTTSPFGRMVCRDTDGVETRTSVKTKHRKLVTPPLVQDVYVQIDFCVYPIRSYTLSKSATRLITIRRILVFFNFSILLVSTDSNSRKNGGFLLVDNDLCITRVDLVILLVSYDVLSIY